MEQAIRFTKVAGRQVAWATVGEGPPLIIGGWWMSHLELDWVDERFRRLITNLARYRTVIRYDRPGTGVSGDDGSPPGSLDEEVEVLSGVIEAVGGGPLDGYAGSAGGPVALAMAASTPGLFERLVVYGSYARGSEIASAESRATMVELIRTHWGIGSKVLTDAFIPSASGEERERFVSFQRQSASAEVAAASLAAVYSFDVSDRLQTVDADVTVLHRRNDRAIPFDLGRSLAAEIPAARFIALDGSDHLPWHGDSSQVVEAVLRGLGVENPEVDAGASPTAASSRAQPETDLSARELEILKLVARGKSDREIAEELVLSPHTVHRHVANIRTKLRQPSRAAAAAHAATRGLI